MQNQKCKNCGGTDHNDKFCYERPKRKIVKIEKPKKEIVEQKEINIPKSKYEEEEKHFGQHTEVWGSYWNEVVGWGFACCYSNTKTEECLGEKGKRKSLTKEYLIKRAIEETPVEQYPVNLAQLYNTSLLREGPQIEIGPQLLKK